MKKGTYNNHLHGLTLHTKLKLKTTIHLHTKLKAFNYVPRVVLYK